MVIYPQIKQPGWYTVVSVYQWTERFTPEQTTSGKKAHQENKEANAHFL